MAEATPPRAGPSRAVAALSWLAPAALGLALGLAVGRPKPKVYSLEVRSDPARAMVFVDGEWRGLTPLALSDVGPGRRRVTIEKSGFLRRTDVVAVEGETRLLAALEKVPTCKLTVSTKPPGALVLVRGLPMGETPVTLEGLPEGALPVAVERQGYDPISEIVPLAAPAVTLTRTLESSSEAYFAKMIAAYPSALNNYTELVHHYMLQGRYDGAIKIMKDGLAAVDRTGQTANDGDRAIARSRFYQEIRKVYTGAFKYGSPGDVQKIRPKLEQALLDSIKEHPASAANYALLAQLYRGANDKDRVRKMLMEAAEKAPRNVGLQFAIGQQLYNERRYRDAAHALARVVAIEPNNFQAHQILGLSLLNVREKHKGIKHLETACTLTQDPRALVQIRTKIALEYVLMRRYDEAVKQWRKVVDMEPDVNKACALRLRVAYYYRRLGQYGEARAMYQAVLDATDKPSMQAMAKRGIERLAIEKKRGKQGLR